MELVTTEKETKIIGRADELWASAIRAEILDAATYEKGVTLCKFIREAIKAAEDERKILVKPLNDHVKMINDRFKSQITEKLDEAKRTIDSKMLTWQRAENERLAAIAAEKRRAEEAEAAKKAAELEAQGKAEAAKAVVAAVAEAASMPETVGTTRGVYGGSASVRKIIDFEVVSFAEVPDMFKTLNEVAIRAAAKSGVKEIPGIRFFEKEILTVR